VLCDVRDFNESALLGYYINIMKRIHGGLQDIVMSKRTIYND
jgi:hypothetical protein